MNESNTTGQLRLTPSFRGKNAELLQQFVEKARKETNLPDLSPSAAIMRLVRREMGQ